MPKGGPMRLRRSLAFDLLRNFRSFHFPFWPQQSSKRICEGHREGRFG
jgi:hypothetical protein